MTDQNYAPFEVWCSDDDEATINLFPHEMDKLWPVFDALGREGNGYDWAALAQFIDQSTSGFVEGAVRGNPEADMLSLYGPAQRIETIAERLSALCQDTEALKAAIQRSMVD